MSSERRTDVVLAHKRVLLACKCEICARSRGTTATAQTGGQSMEGAYQILISGKAPQRAEIAWR